MDGEIRELVDRKKISGDEDVGVKRVCIGVVVGEKFIELGREEKDY